jgi:hypothetical protein
MRIFALLSLLVLLAGTGCESAPKPAPGMAAVRVKVIAEPKAGYRDPNDVSMYDYGPSRPAEGAAFERVDYATLGDIVVWLEPSSGPPATSTDSRPITIDFDATKAASGLARPASVGQRLIFHNRGARSSNVYSVSDGNEFDLGSIAPSGHGEYVIKAAGLIEVLSDASKDPIAQVYAAPTKWVALARSGGAVDFTDVPPGRYKLLSWHPRLPGHESAIDLAANQTARATIKVGVNGLPIVTAGQRSSLPQR